ncbi:MAG: protein-glutamate O-methyltransferase CheR [Bacillota bacterium]|nr:protein-glutamate O-methyltransferase CheR [Bacillota bacterium]
MVNIADKEYKLLTDYILSNYGIKLGEGKRTLVEGRLQGILHQLNFDSFSKYYDYILSDDTGQAASNLMSRITTNHTYFMREPDHFYYFRDTVLPQLKDSVTDKDIRVWSAGCSTGEEAYTLAMIMLDYFGMEKHLWDTNILATDISSRVIDIAKKGEYDNKDIEPLPSKWKSNYFSQINDEISVISEKVKKEVIFRFFNLNNAAFPFKREFHVIFCRNVMIYFNEETKRDLINKFYNSLYPGGYLFIGHSECLNRGNFKFKYVMPSIYRKD